MAEHTRGRWDVFTGAGVPCIKDQDNRLLAVVNINSTPDPTALANARLMAASPDLLAVLREAIADAEKASNPSARFFLYDFARAALAKATGTE